jgi:glycosyltransferase involved in cell wall biosynthesis
MAERLLYLLNVSNPQRLASDSGWLFADILTPALADQGTEVTVGCPVPVTDRRVRHVPLPGAGDKYGTRFTADVAAIAALVRQVEPAVVVANQVEHAAAVRAALLAARSGALLAGYCHYLPFHVDARGLQPDAAFRDGGLEVPVRMQFFTGLAACDRILVHSPVAADWLASAAGAVNLDLSGRVRVVPPPRDPRLVAGPGDHADAGSDSGGLRVLYNHRLYEHYGTGRFVELAALLTTNPAVRLTVMDVTGSRARERRSLDASPERYAAALADLPGTELVSDRGDRSMYRSILARCDVAVAPFRPGCTWSMSVIDCQAMGVPVLAPRLGWLAGAVDPGLGFDEPHDAVKIAEELLADPGHRAVLAAREAARTRALAPELIAARYLAAVT